MSLFRGLFYWSYIAKKSGGPGVNVVIRRLSLFGGVVMGRFYSSYIVIKFHSLGKAAINRIAIIRSELWTIHNMSGFRYHIYPPSLHQTGMDPSFSEDPCRSLMKTSGINMISKSTNGVYILYHFWTLFGRQNYSRGWLISSSLVHLKIEVNSQSAVSIRDLNILTQHTVYSINL